MHTFQTDNNTTITILPIQCSYSNVYGGIYDTAYNQAFVFYDEDEEICMDEFIYCLGLRKQLDLFAARLAHRQIS